MNLDDMDWRTFQKRVKTLYDDGVRPFSWTVESKLIKSRGPYIIDWWGLYVIKLQWKQGTTDSPFENPILEVLLEEEKDSSLTDMLQTVEITSPPGVDVFNFIYIDKLSFAYVDVTAYGFYVPIIGRPQEVKNVHIPVDAVVIMKGYSDWVQDYDVFYFKAHHNGFVPITKGEATKILTSQLIESVRSRKQLPTGCQIELGKAQSDDIISILMSRGKAQSDGTIEISISGMPKHTDEQADYVEINGKWVYKFEDEFTFHLKIYPSQLDETTRPLFEELIGK